MIKTKEINDIYIKISNHQNVQYNYSLNGINYTVIFLAPDTSNNINIPSILAIPKTNKIHNQLVLEFNNCESNDLRETIKQGIETGIELAHITKDNPAPLLIPILPSTKIDGPYFQQFSKEIFYLSENNPYYRIDEQVVNLINKSKKILNQNFSLDIQAKLFINGYSSSGVAAQRFCLIHPELIDTVCIGGASSSIPMPRTSIDYPLGIKNYEKLFNKSFHFSDYCSIKFRYYVSEFELSMKSPDRKDENGNPAPMHDMSYFDRSIPNALGIKQRQLFGQNMFDRVNKQLKILNQNGFNIQHIIIPKRSHNNSSGQGMNELIVEIAKEVYNFSCETDLQDPIYFNKNK